MARGGNPRNKGWTRKRNKQSKAVVKWKRRKAEEQASRLKQQELAAAGTAPSTSSEGQPSTSGTNLEVAQSTEQAGPSTNNEAQPVAVFEEEPPPEPHVPAHPVPTAKICTLAVQPTRLRGIKKTTPRYEDVSQLISRINSTTKGDVNCRLCMGESRMPLIPIFKNQSIQKVPLATKILHITGLTVAEGDGYPESICQPCNKNMVNCYEFRTMCIASDERYRKKKNKAKKSTNENSSDDTQSGARPRKRAKKSRQVIETEEPIDVKLEIEEHNIFETASHFMSDGQDFEQQEAVPPPFATVKVEPEDESMWHPEVSLNYTQRSKDGPTTSQLPDTECKMEFEGDVVCETVETPLTDPLSIPTSDETVSSPPATGPQIPTLTVGNQPSANKRGTYLLAVKPVSASISDPPTYVLAINHSPDSTSAPAFPGNIPANISNLPVITNVPIPLNIRPDTATLPVITNVPVPLTIRSDIVARSDLPIKIDIDPLDDDDSGAKQQ